jgi:CheY-like chemotaxis protein
VGTCEEGETRRLVVVDDDEMTREVLELIAAEAGFACESFATGDEAVALLAGRGAPFAVLTDMQMPGLAGEALAEALRRVCGRSTRLVAMSGSRVERAQLRGFDGFLLKPFSVEELTAALADEGAEGAPVLHEAVYGRFAESLPPDKLAALYTMCLEDARKRLTTMRRSCEERDDDGFRRAAHAVKGSCGMVGAAELAGIAGAMEQRGLDSGSFEDFEAALSRLERMLKNIATER